jgi:hypothetical protein
MPKFINSPAQERQAILSARQEDPGKLGAKGQHRHQRGCPGAGCCVHPAGGSLPVTRRCRYRLRGGGEGLNAFNQRSVGGYIDTPRTGALAEGNGFVFEAVNNVFAVYNTSFGHMTNAEPMEQFWAPAILATGYCSVSDPKAHYDTITRKWFVTEVAYGPPGCAPGSAVFIAVSTSSDPLSIYNIFVLDTSFDGMSAVGVDVGGQRTFGENICRC